MFAPPTVIYTHAPGLMALCNAKFTDSTHNLFYLLFQILNIFKKHSSLSIILFFKHLLQEESSSSKKKYLPWGTPTDAQERFYFSCNKWYHYTVKQGLLFS